MGSHGHFVVLLLRAGAVAGMLGLSACGSDRGGRGQEGVAEPNQATRPQAEVTQTAGAQVGPAPIERGRAVYAEQKCQACHSVAGVGSRRYPLDGVGARLSRDDIRKWIVSPREMNPKVSKRGFDTLPQADLEALVAYVSSL